MITDHDITVAKEHIKKFGGITATLLQRKLKATYAVSIKIMKMLFKERLQEKIKSQSHKAIKSLYMCLHKNGCKRAIMTKIVGADEEIIYVTHITEDKCVLIDYCGCQKHFTIKLTPKEAHQMCQALTDAYRKFNVFSS